MRDQERGAALNPGPLTLDPSGRRRASRKGMIIAIQALIGLALLVAVVAGLWDQAQQAPATGAVPDPARVVGIPDQIGGLRRAETMTGPQALAELQELHGKEVGVIGGWIAHYGKEATVWVGEAQDEARAIQVLEAMTRRIQAGNRYFTGLELLQVQGKAVYTVVGQGQRHYYYRQGRQVIWLAAPPGREEAFLKEALLVVK